MIVYQTTDNADVEEILIKMLTELKKIEYHQFIASDTELKDQDVDTI